MTLTLGNPLPSLTLPASNGKTIQLAKDFAGKNLVVYFYPKDDTPGCTLEGQDFTRLHAEFVAANCAILGVSKDSVKSHDKFCQKFGFPFDLLSDSDEQACNAFGAIVEKSMYGRKYMGVDRCTFLFGKDGLLKAEWRNVKAKGHAEVVLTAVQALPK